MISSSATASPSPITLEAVKARLDHWRAARTKGSKIPETLWDDITQLSKEYGLYEISSALHISLRRLHAHLKDSQHLGGIQETQIKENAFQNLNPTFIKAQIPCDQPFPHQLLGQLMPSLSGSLEIQGNHGFSLKATGLDPQGLIALTQAFLQHKAG